MTMTTLAPVGEGSEIAVKDSEGEKVGTVVSCTPDTEGGRLFMVVVAIDDDSSVAEKMRNNNPNALSMGVTSTEGD